MHSRHQLKQDAEFLYHKAVLNRVFGGGPTTDQVSDWQGGQVPNLLKI